MSIPPAFLGQSVIGLFLQSNFPIQSSPIPLIESLVNTYHWPI